MAAKKKVSKGKVRHPSGIVTVAKKHGISMNKKQQPYRGVRISQLSK